MTDQKKGQPKADLENSQLNNTSSTAQRRRLLARLEQGPVDTLTARRELNILMPAARIKELKDLGYSIQSHRITLTDDHGRVHQGIAQYHLTPKIAARLAA